MIENHIVNLYLIALEDGVLDQREIDAIISIARNKLDPNFTEESLGKLLLSPNIQMNLPNNFFDKIILLFDFVKIIWADNEVKDSEYQAFLRYCKLFDIGEDMSKELFNWLLDLVKKDVSYRELSDEINKLINQ